MGIIFAELEFKVGVPSPWPGDSAGWSTVLYTKRLRVHSPVRAHTSTEGLISSQVYMGSNQSMFLLLPSLSLPFYSSKVRNVSSGED